MTEYIIRGDEAWTPAEWARLERRRQYDRAYAQRADVRARRSAYHREWRERNRAHVNAYSREWMRRYRERL